MRETALRQAKVAATRQRTRLRQRAMATKERLAPGTLYFNARAAAEQQVARGANTAVDTVKAHPLAAGAAVAAVLTWVFREQIGQHVLPAVDKIIDTAVTALRDASDSIDDGE